MAALCRDAATADGWFCIGLSLRTSATLCAFALNPRRLRANRDRAGPRRNQTARSVWTARSLLPLSNYPRLPTAPASWTHCHALRVAVHPPRWPKPQTVTDRPANPVAGIFKGTANDSLSPWGEGRGEGIHSIQRLVNLKLQSSFGAEFNQRKHSFLWYFLLS